MDALVNLADKHKVTLKLVAEPFAHKKVEKDKLKRWYKSYGFKQIGEDYEDEFKRKPQKIKKRNPTPKRHETVNRAYSALLKGDMALDDFVEVFDITPVPRLPMGKLHWVYDCGSHVDRWYINEYGTRFVGQGPTVGWNDAERGDRVSYGGYHFAVVIDPIERIVESCWGVDGLVFQHRWDRGPYDPADMTIEKILIPSKKRNPDAWGTAERGDNPEGYTLVDSKGNVLLYMSSTYFDLPALADAANLPIGKYKSWARDPKIVGAFKVPYLTDFMAISDLASLRRGAKKDKTRILTVGDTTLAGWDADEYPEFPDKNMTVIRSWVWDKSKKKWKVSEEHRMPQLAYEKSSKKVQSIVRKHKRQGITYPLVVDHMDFLGNKKRNPYPNEHAARVADPGRFVKSSFRRMEIEPGISIIVAKLKSGPKGRSRTRRGAAMTTTSYRFKKSKYTAPEARRWLKRHDIPVLKFEAARRG